MSSYRGAPYTERYCTLKLSPCRTCMSRTRISATSCMSYENTHALHSLQLVNLSAFAEHLTRLFPVVGGPRAFAQPNNFKPRRRSIPQYDPSVFRPAPERPNIVFHTKRPRIFSCQGVYSPESHLPFTLLANDLKTIVLRSTYLTSQPSQARSRGVRKALIAKLNLIPQYTSICGIIYYE